MFDLFKTSVDLKVTTAGYTGADGIKYAPTTATTVITCAFYDGGEMRLMMERSGQILQGNDQVGDAAIILQSTDDWNAKAKMTHAIEKDGTRYRILAVMNRPRNWKIITLKKIV